MDARVRGDELSLDEESKSMYIKLLAEDIPI